MAELSRTEYNGLTYVLQQQGKLYTIQVLDQAGDQVGRCKAFIEDCSFNGAIVKAMVIGCVFTRPEHRRGGMARNTFRLLDPIIREQGVLVSYLHPFSFPYYRAMGYERVSDHRVLEFQLSDLEFLPRYPQLEKLTPSSDLSCLDTVYNRFSQGRNGMLQRYGSGSLERNVVVPDYFTDGVYKYDFGKKHCYLSRDEQGEPDGYIIYYKDMPLQDHYLKNGILQVQELCFTSPQALRKLFGFMRMFDGELDRVRIANCGMAPEVERLLRRYKYTDIRLLPDISARCHDVGALLAASTYPKEPGRFTVRVTDSEKSPFSRENTQGVWQVCYGDGKGQVTRLPKDAPADLALTMPAFSQLVHGFENFGQQVAMYLEGVQLQGDCSDFFRAFPNRPAGAFELF